MSMDIQLVEALCGFQKPIAMLDNRTIIITSHPGKSALLWKMNFGTVSLNLKDHGLIDFGCKSVHITLCV